MSNHTNSDLYYKNLLINRHVGGTHAPQLQTTNEYIAEQRKVLTRQNPDLPPNVRYNANIRTGSRNMMPNNDIRQTLQDSYSHGKCASCPDVEKLQFSNQGTSDELQDEITHRGDVYMRGDTNRYDPYSGYLYDRGLMSDGHQRRRITSTYIDVNSSYRAINPSVTTDTPIMLEKDPLEFQNNSNVCIIHQANHKFEVGDSITITNVFSRISTLRTYRGTLPTFEIPIGCNFMKIYYDHSIPLTYSGMAIQIQLLEIKGDRGSSTVASFLGSIPINTINVNHTVKLTLVDSEISCPTQTVIDRTGDPNYFTPSPEYFFIILPFAMRVSYTLNDYNFRLLNLSLAGIPINQINSVYPIDAAHLSGYKTIIGTTKDTYNILLDSTSIINQTIVQGGGSCVTVALVTGINVGYPYPNEYIVDLGDTIHNVIAARLVSTEIPNTDRSIRDSPTGRINNKIYWNDIDDGDYLYSIQIPAGNYTPVDLIRTMQNLFYNTSRISAVDPATRELLGITYTATHFMQVTIDSNTDIVTFKSFKEFILQTPIIAVIPDISSDPTIPVDATATYQLTIKHPKHGMPQPGQTILIQGAINYKGILGSVINGEKVVSQIIDQDTYNIILPKFDLIENRADTGGGTNVFIYIPDFFRLRFDLQDTMGTVLGFRNAGQPSSITPFSTVVSNKNPYEFEPDVNAVGQTIQITNNAIQLSGENYIVMVARPIQTLLAIGKIKDAFAKILLCDSPGKVLFNTFVPITHFYEDPLNELHQLKIAFYTSDGNLFNFNGVEHSFTLEIITINDIPEGTGINANTGKNYNQEVR